MSSSERTRLVQSVATLAAAIANGDCLPQIAELQALAAVCDAHHLQAEAARIRRWMGLPTIDPSAPR